MSIFSRLAKRSVESTVARSIDPFSVMQNLCIAKTPTIFDVGAHHGSISRKFRSIFPNGQVYAFEPFPESYGRLLEICGDDPFIEKFNFGLSIEKGYQFLSSNFNEQTNSVLETHERGKEIWGPGLLDTKERISLYFDTIDSILEQRDIPEIDILKMDVQGAEYLVMKGAENAISSQKIALIYTEIITLPTYKNQKVFHEVLKLFCDYGFQLHDLYNMSRTNEGTLRQVDAIFIRN